MCDTRTFTFPNIKQHIVETISINKTVTPTNHLELRKSDTSNKYLQKAKTKHTIMDRRTRDNIAGERERELGETETKHHSHSGKSYTVGMENATHKSEFPRCVLEFVCVV